MGVPHILTSKTVRCDCMRCSAQSTSHRGGLHGGCASVVCPDELKHHLLFIYCDIIPARASQAPHIQLGEKEAMWRGRSGGPPQNSMPTPLVYNGPVRITAGAWRAAKGTQRSLVCLFYKPRPCSVCKVPVGFVEPNSRPNQTRYSVSTIAATLQPPRARSAE